MKIGIVSLGLIGGSLFKKLADFSNENEIFAVTRNQNTINKAKNYSNNVSSDLKTLKNCDVIFVASPINKTLEILDKLEEIASPNCIVLDCASVKDFVMQKNRPYKFIGSHPMAGTEFTGFDASFKELFENAKWVLTPSQNVDDKDIDTVTNIIKKTGAEIIIADAKQHDEAVALISHMPLLLAQALFYTVKDNELALKLASSGFRDMTRLACSNLEMAADMRNFNSSNITNSIDKLKNSLNFLQNTKDLKIYSEIKDIRSKMYSKEGKNIF